MAGGETENIESHHRIHHGRVDGAQAVGTVEPFEGDLADYSRFVLSGAEPQQRQKREPHAAAAARPKREPQPIKREIAALEDKMNRFQDLLHRIDDALAQASARNSDAAKMADLAAKRAELERAIIATERAWFELTAEVEQT